MFRNFRKLSQDILIEACKDPKSENWSSLMYRTKNGVIHKLLLSMKGFPYTSREEAITSMENDAKAIVEYIKTNFNYEE